MIDLTLNSWSADRFSIHSHIWKTIAPTNSFTNMRTIGFCNTKGAIDIEVAIGFSGGSVVKVTISFGFPNNRSFTQVRNPIRHFLNAFLFLLQPIERKIRKGDRIILDFGEEGDRSCPNAMM